MILQINGWLCEPTDFTPTKDDNPYYNIEVKLVRTSMKLRFNHTQFYRENPEWVLILKRLYDETNTKL